MMRLSKKIKESPEVDGYVISKNFFSKKTIGYLEMSYGKTLSLGTISNNPVIHYFFIVPVHY